MTVKRGSSSVNVVVLLVAILAMGVGAYFYASREQPFTYESTGNVVRFSDQKFARNLAKADFSFPMTDVYEVTIVGSFSDTGGLVDMDAAFELHIVGVRGGLETGLPFTRDELIARIEKEIDEKLSEKDHVCKSDVLELSAPELKEGGDKEKKDNDTVGPIDLSGPDKADGKADGKADEKSEK